MSRVVEITPSSAFRRFALRLTDPEVYTLIYYLAEGRKRSDMVDKICKELEDARGNCAVRHFVDEEGRPT